MRVGQKTKKKGRVWLPYLLWVLFLAITGGLLGWAGFHFFFPKDNTADTSPTATQEPPPPPTGDRPPAGRSRPPILDRNLTPLAVSFKQASVYLSPLELQEAQKPLERLASILGLKEEKLRADLRTARKFVWIKRNIEAPIAQQIAEAKLSGVFLVDEEHRFYPFHDRAAHVVGFEKENQGLAGGEFLYNSILRGDRTLASQSLSLPGIAAADIPVTGAAVVVAIDLELQIVLEKKLQFLLQQTGAQTASAVIMEAESGEILALANLPAYDPNIYWKAAGSAHQNRLFSEPAPIAGLNAYFRAGAELASGNLPAELTSEAEETAPVISPRAVKIIKSDAPGPTAKESQAWQPGIHLSPPFAWPLTYTAQTEATNDFCRKLGLGAPGSGLAETLLDDGTGAPMPTDSCRLDDNGWQVMPLRLLGAFAGLTNGGKRVQPHLLKGLWRVEDGSLLPLSPPAGEGVGSQASNHFLRFVEGLQPPGPGESIVLEALRSSKRLSGAVQAKVEEQEPTAAIEDALRFSSTTLAAGRQGEHQLALLLLLDGARRNLTLPSPTRRAATEIIHQGHVILGKRWGSTPSAPRIEADEILYKRWAESQTLESPSRPSAGTEDMEMPEVMGMSLRKAMQTVQGYNLKVSIQGSGTVIKQTPTAGAPLKDVNEIQLELRQSATP